MADIYHLDILRELREAAGLTQDEMAAHCGLQGQLRRQTAGAWERGDMIPTRARRIKFMGYLWDALNLRQDPVRFEQVWEVLMVEWDWEPISDKEWAAFTKQARPPRSDAVDQQLADLTSTLTQLQRDLGASPTPGKAEATFALPLTHLPEAAPLPAGSRMPLARNPLFVGRAAELLTLARAFANHDTAATAAISQMETAAATGLGGIGKTQLASEFVHRYGQFFTGGVFWLNFDNEDAIAGEVAACGGAGAMELRPDFATRNLEEQVRLVQAAWQTNVPRLLVFDNCEAPALLARWRPTSGGCRVLVTSRCLEWDLALGVQLHALDVLRREESLQLLQKHKLNATLETLNAIAAELGDLPLALHLAGSYLHRYRRVLTAEQYLAFLRDPALLTHPSLTGAGTSPTGHVQHVARTFALSYQRLDADYQLDARARQILVHLALLAPGEPAPYDLLAETLDTDLTDPQQAVSLDEAVIRLLELGLIDVQNEQQLRVHRLVATFVRESAPDLAHAAQPRVEAAIQRKLEAYQEAIHPLDLLPIQSHLRYVVDGARPRKDAQCAKLSHAFARFLWGMGEFDDAEKYTELGLAIRQKQWGSFHAETATSYHLMGMLHQERNNFEQAHRYLQRALEIRLKVVGENHFDTADTLADLGALLWSEQRLGDAIACLERALAICDAALEEDAPLVGEIAMNLALCLLDGGYEISQARHYMQESIRIRLLKLGEDHPYTALSYTNMGLLLHQTGNLADAVPYYQKGLAIRERVYGKKHQETAHSLYSLGRLLRMQEQWDEAQHYLEQALAIYHERHGEEYFLTASCLNEMGAVCMGKQEIANAHAYLARALAIRQKLYPPAHPFIANTLQNLGMAHLQEGKVAVAETLLLQVLEMRRQGQDPENLRTAETLQLLGRTAISRQQLSAARDFYLRALTIYQRLLGSENPLTQKVTRALDALDVEN